MQKTLVVKIPPPWDKGPLRRHIDSTDIGVVCEGEWHARKHGGPKRRVRREIQLGIDKETLQVRAVDTTGSHICDAPVLPDLFGRIPIGEEIGSVTADGAHDPGFRPSMAELIHWINSGTPLTPQVP